MILQAVCPKHGCRVFSAMAPDLVNPLGNRHATAAIAILVNPKRLRHQLGGRLLA